MFRLRSSTFENEVTLFFNKCRIDTKFKNLQALVHFSIGATFLDMV